MSVRWPGLDDPDALPNEYRQDSYSEGTMSNLIKTTMNNGPSKRRKRTTTTYQPIQGTMTLTSEQRSTFLDFYKNDTAFGAIPVIMREQGTLDGEVQVFINSQKIAPINGRLWSLSLTTEVKVG